MARRKKADMNGEANGVAVADQPNGEVTQATNGAPSHNGNGAEEKRQPAHVVKLRSVRIAIWANVRQDNSVWYSTTPSRSYRDDAGNWHTSENFGGQDLLLLAEAARLAFHWIVSVTQTGEVPF